MNSLGPLIVKHELIFYSLIFLGILALALGLGLGLGLRNSGSENPTPDPDPPVKEKRWVAVGYDTGDDYGNIMYSTDGMSWTKTSLGDSFSIRGYGVAYG